MGEYLLIIWINGAFGAGKTTAAFELHRRLPNSFVYDPENVGFFIRKNAPAEFGGGDFQDIPLWRQMNYEMISLIASEYKGTIIIPMTIVNPEYYNEIVGRLISDGHDLRHFILYASRAALLHRLRFRLSSFFGGDTFAKNSIDRCIYAFDNLIKDEKIDTEHMNPDQVVEETAARCGLDLPHDNKTKLGRLIYRLGVLIGHIR